MKSLFFTICLIAGFAYNAQSQKMAAQLQSKKWYANGAVGKGVKTADYRDSAQLLPLCI